MNETNCLNSLMMVNRPTAKAFVKAQCDELSKELAAWNWLSAAMEAHPMTEQEEAAVYELLTGPDY